MTVFTGPSYATPDYPGTFWELVEHAAQKRGDAVVLADDHGRAVTAAPRMNRRRSSPRSPTVA